MGHSHGGGFHVSALSVKVLTVTRPSFVIEIAFVENCCAEPYVSQVLAIPF